MQKRANRIQKPYEKMLRRFVFDIKVYETNIPAQEIEEQ
jgi:hypothetical protein